MNALAIPIGARSATLPVGANIVRHRRVILVRKPMRVYLQPGAYWYAVVGLSRRFVGWVRVREVQQ